MTAVTSRFRGLERTNGKAKGQRTYMLFDFSWEDSKSYPQIVPHFNFATIWEIGKWAYTVFVQSSSR